MGHHRFKAQFTVILEMPGNQDTSPDTPMPDDLANQVIKAIEKTNAKKGAQPYNVKKAVKD